MKKTVAIFIGSLIVVVLVLFGTTYTVNYHEVAVVSRFGEVNESSIVRESGLHVRAPFFVDSVRKMDTRIQVVETPLENLQTIDGQQIVFRMHLVWKIEENEDGPLLFYRSFGSKDEAKRMVDSQLRSAASLLSEYTFSDLIGVNSKIPEAESRILSSLDSLRNSGISPEMVGISRLMLPRKTANAVLKRMRARSNMIAENERTRGQAAAQRIESLAVAQVEQIRAFALGRSEEIRAESEEQAAKYLREMAKDEELAIFLSWLDALEKALSENTTVILDSKEAPWHLMDLSSIKNAKGIPQPQAMQDRKGNK